METSIVPKKFAGLFEIRPASLKDHRGSLTRLYDRNTFDRFKLDWKLAQESLFYTERKNTIRGLHFSLPPQQERKIVTAIRGVTQWVAVDLRRDSRTFGQWDDVILTGETRNSLCAEAGFAHGCLSLTDDCELLIKTNIPFESVRSGGIKWNDQALVIDWMLESQTPIIISSEHNEYKTLKAFLNQHQEEL